MKVNRRHLVLVSVIVALGSLYALVVRPVVVSLAEIARVAEKGNRGHRRLFFETDYEQLLSACSEL